MAAALSVAALAGCQTNQVKLGGGSTEVTGSAGHAGNQGQSEQLIRCARPIGYAALLEPDHPHWSRYGLSSPVPLIRLMMAQSGCFRVVDRGAASTALQRERALAARGELQTGSSMGGGQMVAADYIITPNVVHQDENSGGAFGGLGAYLPGVPGAIAGGLRTQNLEAQTVLFVTNVRTGVQEAVAEGSATKRDIGFGGVGWAGVVAGVGGGYEDTEIGKIVAAAFMDAHNKLVTQLGAIPASHAQVQRQTGGGWYTASAVNFRSGPSTNASVIRTLPKGTPLVPTGEKRGPWWAVDAEGQSGWLHSDFVMR
jgi:curli biogenesis system outer membrane secretion channel CsgG